MIKTFKGVLIGLFLLSMNLFGVTIDTRNPDVSYKKDDKNIIWTEGTEINDNYKDYWRDHLAESEGWVDPYLLLSGLRVISYSESKDGKESIGNHGELMNMLIDAEYDLQSIMEIKADSAQKPGDRYNRTIQFKLVDVNTNEIGFIFSIRNIKLLPYANISWDLDSADLYRPDGSLVEGPEAIFIFSNVISYLYQVKNGDK